MHARLADNPAPKLTADQFLAQMERLPGRWELLDGDLVMMAGGSLRHAGIAANIVAALRTKLRGSGCAAFGSDMAVRLNMANVCLPDATVVCDRRDLDRDPLRTFALDHPSVIFEVLSPTTETYDRSGKVRRYHEIETLRLVVLVDPVEERLDVYERAEAGWRFLEFPRGADLKLRDPDLVLSADDIFARD